MRSFDDQIRDKFSGYEPEVPAHIWENIAKRNKKRRFFFWFNLNANIGLLMISLALLGGGTFLFKNLTSKKENKPLSSGNRFASGSRQPAAKTEEQIPLSADAQNNEQNRIIENSVNLAIAGNSIIENNISQTEKTASPEKNDFAKTTKTNSRKEAPHYNKSEKGLTAFTRNKSTLHSYTSESDATTNSNALEALFPLNFRPEANEKKGYRLLLLNKTFNRQEIPCPERDAAGNKRYIELYAGPDYVFRSFSDTGHSDYLAKRKETTSYSFAYSIGGRYTRVFSNGTSIRAGVNFSQTIEKFSQVIGNYTHTEYTVINGTDTIGSYIVSGKLYRTNYNKYNTIDIPVTIGYEIGNGRLHANINAGAMINVYSWQKGLVIDPSDRAVSITTGDSPSPYQFKSNIGLGFLGSVSMYYKLNDRLHLIAEPYFRYNLSASNKEEITLKQKFHTAGLRAGLRFDLR